MRFKPLIAIVVSLAIGAGLGYAASWWRLSYTVQPLVRSITETLTLGPYAVEVQEAKKQIKNPEPLVAIYALDRAVRFIELFELSHPRRVDCVEINYNLGRFNTRLAQLYAQTGKKDLSQKHRDKALLAFAKMGWQLDSSQASVAFPLIESVGIPATMKQLGKITSSCRTK